MSKISELSDGGSLVSSDYLIAVRSGGNVKVRMDQINVDQIDLGDNEFIRLGNSQDLTIVHNASNSIINQAGIGNLLIQKAGTTKASITANGLEFPDNSKAIFGAGSDLQIGHDGSVSFITDSGTGDLYIQGSSAIRLTNPAGNETFAVFNDNGAASLYYDNGVSLSTTASGIDITGSVTADGLTVQTTGSTTAVLTLNNADGNGTLSQINLGYTADPDHGNIQYTGDMIFTAAAAERLRITSTGVGIGCTPATPLNVAKTGDGTIIRLLSVGIGEWDFSMGNSSTLTGVGAGALELLPLNSGTGSEFAIGQAGSSTPVFHIKSGNVGIGMSSPSAPLNISATYASDTTEQFRIQDNTGGKLDFFGYANGSKGIQAYADDGSTFYNLKLNPLGGNVGIGLTTGISSKLHVNTEMSIGADADNRAIVGYTPNRFYIGTRQSGTNYFDTVSVSGGNLLVGKTTAGFANTGHELRGGGSYAAFTRDGGSPVLVNRKSSDGTLVEYMKDGTTVGSIGSRGGVVSHIILDPRSGGAGLTAAGASLFPTNNAGAVSDAAIDLGYSVGGTNYRFKDLYLSGTANANSFATAAGGTFTTASGNDLNIVYPAGRSLFIKEGSETHVTVDNVGNLLVGTTSLAAIDGTPTTTGIGLRPTGSQLHSVGNGGNAVEFGINGTGLVGSINCSGSATSYNTSSDQRLKENIVDAPSASDDIDAIQVRSFDWKSDGSHQKYGMVAQELQSVAPEAVSAPEDPEEMMGVDYSKLVPMLVKEIQSLRARVAQLES